MGLFLICMIDRKIAPHVSRIQWPAGDCKSNCGPGASQAARKAHGRAATLSGTRTTTATFAPRGRSSSSSPQPLGPKPRFERQGHRPLPRARRALPACPSNPSCCLNADAHTITREEHENARDVARAVAKTDAYVTLMRLRKKVEALFANLKRILGPGQLSLRGQFGASDESRLAATAQNLSKLAKTFPLPSEPATP